MTTRAQLTRAALGLPGVDQRTGNGDLEFAVADRVFVRCDADGRLEFALPPDEAATLSPDGGGNGLRIADLDGQQLNHWVRRAWLHRAPAELAAPVVRADRARPGEVGDLPRAIGAPATRALVAAGVETLDELARRTPAEILALHGVGARAVDVLAAALADRGIADWARDG